MIRARQEYQVIAEKLRILESNIDRYGERMQANGRVGLESVLYNKTLQPTCISIQNRHSPI